MDRTKFKEVGGQCNTRILNDTFSWVESIKTTPFTPFQTSLNIFVAKNLEVEPPSLQNAPCVY